MGDVLILLGCNLDEYKPHWKDGDANHCIQPSMLCYNLKEKPWDVYISIGVMYG